MPLQRNGINSLYVILGLFLLLTALEISHATKEQLRRGHAGPRGKAKKCRKMASLENLLGHRDSDSQERRQEPYTLCSNKPGCRDTGDVGVAERGAYLQQEFSD